MDPMQNSEVVYFYSDQIAVVLHSKLDPRTLKQQIHTNWPDYMTLLQQQLHANQSTSNLQLKSFEANEVPHTWPGHQDELADLPGVYVFHTQTDVGPKGAIVAFFHIISTSTATMASGGAASPTDTIRNVILQLQQDAGQVNTHPDFSSSSSSPHWLLSSVGEIIHGCPVVPPIPVDEPQTEGHWALTFELAEPELQDATGKGATVFVLDAFPSPDQVSEAASRAGSRNLLLQRLANGLFEEKPQHSAPSTTLTYVDFPAAFTTVATGKDVTGELVGFPMADHGLCIAGMIRDLAPGADIECIRVLNDYGVGDAIALVDALYTIQNRLLDGDQQHGSVVVNLSLVSLPPEGTLSALGLKSPPFFDMNLAEELRDVLFTPLKSLAALGVIFVTAAGNDSDPRDKMMNPTGGHFVARYPAQFASESDPLLAASIVPVGAVDQTGEATIYSNYPGSHGVATYAGSLPTFLERTPSPDNPSKYSAQMPVDAIRGVYTSPTYPILLAAIDLPVLPDFPQAYPHYSAPNQNGWAYWTGTSFATPIITALAARALEWQAANGDNIRRAISTAALQEANWKDIQQYDQSSMGGGMEGRTASGMQMQPTQNANVPVINVHQQWHSVPISQEGTSK